MQQLRTSNAAARIPKHPLDGKSDRIPSQSSIRIEQQEKITTGIVRRGIHTSREANIPLHPFVMNLREQRRQEARRRIGRAVIYHVNLFGKRVCGSKYRLNRFTRLLAGIARQKNNGNVQTVRS